MVLIFFILLFAAVFIISLLVYAIKSFVIAFWDAWRNYNPDATNNDTNENKPLNLNDLDTLQELENTHYDLIAELTHLRDLERGYKELSLDLKKQLEKADEKKAITIKRQLLTLDNKSYSINKKIRKIIETLEKSV